MKYKERFIGLLVGILLAALCYYIIQFNSNKLVVPESKMPEIPSLKTKSIKMLQDAITEIGASVSSETDILLALERKLDQIITKTEKLESMVKKKDVKQSQSIGLPDLPSTANKEHIRRRELESFELDHNDIVPLPKPKQSEMNDRWIVVTSIFGPTEDIRKISKIPGWKLVVVGDKKTPKDWKLDGVVFLSVEDQLKSGFETVQFLKYGVYQRKNMGFLYAIQHGAKYIYDTDDDNHPYGGKITFDEMTNKREYLMYNGDRTYYNGFAHFGQSSLWPRGYPLNKIDKAPVRNYKSCTEVRPLVQQGVVDGDPDLDAIQRLTRKDSDVKFVVYFDITAPPVVLPPNSFVPYNSQNTFHHYDAFFTLLLPQTVTFRVNDIWRSFISQRLLWDIGGHHAYFPPNAYQDRTPHDFLKDFYEEDGLYRNTLPLTELLLKWKGKSKNMIERHFEVIKEIYKQDILGALDLRLARAWARDLMRIGYIPPKMRPSEAKCKSNNVTFTPKEMPTLFLRIGQKTVNVIEEGKKLPLTKERERDTN